MAVVVHTQADGIAVLSLNRPEALNAISGQTVRELNAALDRIETDETSGLVLTGMGRAFCAGADLKEAGLRPEERVAEMHELVLRLAGFPKISVAAINGLALGGGLELAMACTLRVAATDVPMGLPEAKRLGLFPAYGGTQLLPRLVGEAKALELILTGEPVDSREALRIGLINRVADDCVKAAIDLARAATVATPAAVSIIRRLVAQGDGTPLAEGLAREAAAVTQVLRTVEVPPFASKSARPETTANPGGEAR